MIIAVDFDGTCVHHLYPQVGEELELCSTVLRALVANGHQLILYTMRSGDYLNDAVQWWKERGIEIWGVNENPEQEEWTSSRKVYAHIYIDDAALGVPLNEPKGHEADDRPYVNWRKVAELLYLKHGLLTARQAMNMGIA